MKNLERYYNWLKDRNENNKGFAEVPEELKVKTLWIPRNSSNRTAIFDLNHGIDGFDKKGNLIGYNYNCWTEYVIVEVPLNWTEEHISQLEINVAKAFNTPKDFPIFRVLEARTDKDIEIISNEINKMIK